MNHLESKTSTIWQYDAGYWKSDEEWKKKKKWMNFKKLVHNGCGYMKFQNVSRMMRPIRVVVKLYQPGKVTLVAIIYY